MSDVKWTIPKGESDRQIEDVQMMFMHKKNILKVYLLLPSPGNKLNNYPPPKERWELKRSCKVINNQPNKKTTLQSILWTQQAHGSVVFLLVVFLGFFSPLF